MRLCKLRRVANETNNCPSKAHIETIANEPLLKTIKQLGGWPVLGSQSGWTGEREKSFDWLELLIKFRQLGFSHDVLIDLSVTPDFRNNTKHIVDVSGLTRARNIALIYSCTDAKERR